MVKSPEDRRKGFRSIEGGHSRPPLSDTQHGDTLDSSSVDWVQLHAEAARRIIKSFENDPARARSDLSIWNVDIDDAELVQIMHDWQNYPDKDQFGRVCACAQEYLRRLNAGLIRPKG